MGKPRRKERNRAQRKKNFRIKVLVVLIVIAAAVVITHLPYFNVQKISVKGNDMVSSEEILSASGIKKDRSIFDANTLLVSRKVKKNLYIEKVELDKKYPDRIVIKVTEKSGRMQFVFGKKFVVTDNTGKVIEIADQLRPSALIEGVTVESAEPGKTIKVKEEKVFSKASEFIKTTESNDLYFKKLVINKNQVEAYVFDDLVCTGEYDYVMNSIESGTLRSVIYDLYQKDKLKGSIKITENDYCFFTQKK